MDRCVLVGTGGTRPLTHVRCTPGRPQRPQITSPKKTIMEHLQCWQVGRERCGGCHRAFGESNGSNQSSLKKTVKIFACLFRSLHTHWPQVASFLKGPQDPTASHQVERSCWAYSTRDPNLSQDWGWKENKRGNDLHWLRKGQNSCRQSLDSDIATNSMNRPRQLPPAF